MSSRAPSTAASTGVAPAWGKSALLVGLFFATCWGGAIVYWRMTERMPSAGELAICLVGAPLLMSGALWLSRRMIEHPRVAGAAPGTSGAAARPAPENSLVILDCALRLPCGSSAGEVCAAIKAHKARPGLDRELVDDDGFPVMTARCADADDEALREEIAKWMGENGFTDAGFIDEHWRALVLATQVAGDLARGLDASLRMVRLLPVPASTWSAVQRRAAGAWLACAITQSGWAADRVALAPEAPADASLAAIVTDLENAGDEAELTMLVAFASNIGVDTVSQWSANRTLFTSANPNGLIPGEGAAGLLVARPKSLQAGAAGAGLSTMIEASRDKPADDARRADKELLVDLATRALDQARIEPAQIAAIVGDTGPRPNRLIELMGLAAAVAPQLDPTDDVIRTGIATCGAVPSFSALILARHRAEADQKPVIWASNEDRARVAVAIVHP